MKKHNHDLFCFQSLLLIHLVLNRTSAFELKCPSLNQWILRARSQCVITDGYICLFDVNQNDFGEKCRDKPYFESPGYKFVIVGNLDRRKCESTRYQPFTFSTDGRETCIFEKTFCSEEGQIISSNGSTKVDRQCRCDYTRGYDFITKPERSCYCVPSMEDCSCYQKPCPLGLILNPDYQCVNLSTWNSQSTCESILPERSRNTIFPLDDKSKDDSPTGSERNLKIVLCIAIVIAIIVVLLTVVLMILRVPKFNVHELQEHLKLQCEEQFYRFIPTRAFNKTKEMMLTEQCVLISGPHGCGKSSSAFHIAMELVNKLEYDFMIISKPEDLLKYASKDRKQLFLIDDIFGKYCVNDYNIVWWNHHNNSIQGILRKNKNLKILMTSRLHIYKMVKLNQMKITFCHINLISDEISLTLEERINIGRCYIKNDINNLDKNVVISYSWFPAICANFRDTKEVDMIEYFALPVAYIMPEIENIRKSPDLFYLALSILIICDNNVTKDFFKADRHKSGDMLTLVSKEIGYGGNPSLALLFSHFIALKGTYVLEKKHAFECLHLNLFNTLSFCIAPRIMRNIFVYGKSSFINARMQLETRAANYPKQTIMVPKSLQIFYFDRLLNDINEGLFDTFSGYQHVFLEFRESFIAFLKNHLNNVDLKQGRHGTTVLHAVSAEGYDDYANVFLDFNKAMLDLQDNLGKTALHDACIKGCQKVAQLLLKKGAGISKTDNDGNTALDFASHNGFTEIVQLLLSHKAPIIQKRTDLKSALHVACSNNNQSIAKLLLQNKANINDKDMHGHTPLHLACRNGHVNIVKLLIKNQSHLNINDNKSRTPLFLACTKINLLHNGDHKTKANQDGQAPDYIALKDGTDDTVSGLSIVSVDKHECNKDVINQCHLNVEDKPVEVVKELLNAGANVNASDENGMTPFHKACEVGDIETVNVLIKAGAYSNKVDNNGKRPLHMACSGGQVDTVKLLLSLISNVHEGDYNGVTPLHMACKGGNVETVNVLLKAGGNVQEVDKNRKTLLHMACESGNIDTVRLLLNSGANVNEENKSGNTPFHMACRWGHVETVNLLLNLVDNVHEGDKNGVTPLHMACKSGNVETVNVLLKAGCNVNAVDKNGKKPLHMACESRNIDTVKVLFNAGANVNVIDKDNLTPLHVACVYGDMEIVRVLLKAGANVNEEDKNRKTPLHMACNGGHVETVNLLLKIGSIVKKGIKDGFTPLHMACKGTNVDPCEEANEDTSYGIASTVIDVDESDNDVIAPLQMTNTESREKIVEMLISAGADGNRCDKDGITPLHIARSAGNKRIVDLMLVKT